MTPEGIKLARICREYALDKKCLDPVILDLRGLEGPASYFLICSGQSDPHLKAISEAIQIGLKEDFGMYPFAKDGTPSSHWFALDYGDVLIHIMNEEKRVYYNLEDLWGDALKVA